LEEIVMPEVKREGTFKNREKFVEGLRGVITKLRSGPLSAMKEEWKEQGKETVATLKGMGVTVDFTVREKAWSCEADVPFFMPKGPVEDMLDRALAGLKDL
jgi:hypothetical protein